MAEHMTKIQSHKRDAVKELRDGFAAYNDFVFTDYRGLTVQQITALRAQLRKLNAGYKVIKNNFARIAFSDLEYPDVSAYLVGPTAVALSRGETGQVIKQILDFSRESTVRLKGGLVDRMVFDAKQAEAFSRLPGRRELLAMLMGTMNAPLQNAVYAMNGVTSKLVRTLQAVADKKGA